MEDVKKAYNTLINFCEMYGCDKCDLYKTNRHYPEEVCLAKQNKPPMFWEKLDREE